MPACSARVWLASVLPSNPTYRAKVIRVVDGDTVRLSVDVGFRMRFEDSFRLYGIDAPEGKSTPAAAYLSNRLAPGQEITVATYKPDKYGRWLCDLITDDGDLLNMELVRAGLAVPYFGGAK